MNKILVLVAALAGLLQTGSARAADAPPALKGIAIVNNPQAVQASGTPNVEGVAIQGLPFLDRADFKNVMKSYLGKPLDEKARKAILVDIVKFYREQGRIVVDASTPPQEITGGVLQVLVLEGKIGQVRVKGNHWFSSSDVLSQIHAQPGKDIDAVQLGNDLDWINRNPFRQVDIVYVKGSELGQTDIELRETDAFPVRVYGGYEDSGTETTSENRLFGGLNWGNVFGGDGQMNYQYMFDPAMKWFRANSASFIQPLPWRHILTVFGSYADTHGRVGQPFDLSGFNWQASARYEIPLPKKAFGNTVYTQAFDAGFDFKRSNNDLAFGGTQVFGGIADTIQWSAIYNSSLKDRWGETTLRGTYVFSPGDWDVNNTDGAYDNARKGAKAHYNYGKLELNRTTGLPWDWVFANQLTGQLSDTNLLASEQLGFGGYDTIRGYDQRVVNGDEGVLLSNELRTPPISPMAHWRKDAQDKLQFLGFFDYGTAINNHRLPGEGYQTVLAGVGPGLRYSISTWLSFRMDYGWQLHNVGPQGQRPYASRSHIGLVASF